MASKTSLRPRYAILVILRVGDLQSESTILPVNGETMLCSIQGTLETILVVDNDEAVLNPVVKILEGANFRVVSALSAETAIKLAAKTTAEIHLLLCKVDMPRMSGPDLGKLLKKSRPDIHVMLMTGQENGNLLVLNYGWAYIHKNIVAVKLIQMVTDVLHAPDRSQLGDEFDSAKDTDHKAV
jgi:DNA-binding NtrC family response regulator